MAFFLAIQVPLLQEGRSMQHPTPKTDSTVDKGKGKQVLTQNTSPTESSSSPQSTPTTSKTHSPHTQPRQGTMPCSHNMKTSSVTRWIPKRLLQVQGYFKCKTDVWLPHQLHHQEPTSHLQSKPRQRKAKKTQHQRRTHQRWVPIPILKGQGFYQGND